MQVEPQGRTLLGFGLLLLLILVWSIIVASVSSFIHPLPWPVHALFYAVAGLIWILPLKPLMRWMATGKWRA